MKIKKTVIVIVLVLLLVMGVAVGSFNVGVRVGNMQAQATYSEFLRTRGGQAGDQGSNPSPTGSNSSPRGGPNPVMDMIHGILGVNGQEMQGIH